MSVDRFTCPRCGDTWDVPDVDDPRETCRECGADLDHEVIDLVA